MSRQAPHISVVVATILAALTGCHPQEPFYLKNVDNDLKYYKGEATQIDYPEVTSDRLPDTANAMRPFSLENRDPKNFWELTLEEAMQIAMKNNKVMRDIGGQVLGPSESVLSRLPDNWKSVPSIYDPALYESDPVRGTEAALSAFDTQLSTAVIVGKHRCAPKRGPRRQHSLPQRFAARLGHFPGTAAKDRGNRRNVCHDTCG